MTPMTHSGGSPPSAPGGFARLARNVVGSRSALVYMGLFSALGVGYLALETWWLFRFGDPTVLRRDAFLCLYILALGLEARFLSFPIGSITITLNTPIVVAAIFHVGPVPTGAIVLSSMLVYGAWRMWRGEDLTSGNEEPLAKAIRYLFAPAVTAMLAMLLARDYGATGSLTAIAPWPFVDTAGQVLAITALFLLLQYAVVVSAYALEGGNISRLVRTAVLPGILAEFALAPVAVLFVWALDRGNPFPFVLLGIVYIAIADIFHRLASARTRTLQTIGELEWLIHAGERVSAVLSYPQVLRQLSEAIFEAIPDALGALSGIWDEEEDRYVHGVRGADRAFRVDPPLGGIGPLVESALRTGAPGILEGGSGKEGFSLAIVPFTVGDQREGYIGVVLRGRASRDPRSQAGELASSASDVLRKLGSIAAIAIHNARLYRLATLDGMTGLYVRRYFDRRYAEELSRARRYNKPLSVLLVDLDDFKAINDTFGHPVGDRVLQGVAASIRSDVRGADVPCRYGGDEFVVLLPETATNEASETARRLKSRIEGLRILHDGHVVGFTVSMGVATFDPATQSGAPDLVDVADQALYRAKDAPGKARVVVAPMGE